MNVRGDAEAWLRAEAAAVTVATLAGLFAFGLGGLTIWAAVVIALLPDLSIAGYLGGAARGALAYNLVHSYLGPGLLLALTAVLSLPAPVTQIALLWTLHIALDRVLGFGLKRASGFRDTHLGRIGRGDG